MWVLTDIVLWVRVQDELVRIQSKQYGMSLKLPEVGSIIASILWSLTTALRLWAVWKIPLVCKINLTTSFLIKDM